MRDEAAIQSLILKMRKALRSTFRTKILPAMPEGVGGETS